MVVSTSTEGKVGGETCPICDGALGSETSRCPSCGFPTALLPEARKAVQEEVAQPTPVSEGGGALPRSDTSTPGGIEPTPVVLPILEPGPEVPPSSASGLNMEQTAVALQASLKVAQLMGLDTGDVASALTAAAMAAARGAMDESLKVLRDAYDQLEPQLGSRFESLATQLEEQEGRLREDGIAADVARDVSRSRTAFAEGARIEAVEVLTRAQRALAELEGAWKQVKDTLHKVDGLRETGMKLGMDMSKADERLGQVRETLAEPSLSAATLQEAGTQASAALVLLHEQVRNQIALLGQQAIRSLRAHPPPPGEREKAETHLKAILGHARAGRLKEASEEMIDFRGSFLSPARPSSDPGAAPSEAGEAGTTEPAPSVPASSEGVSSATSAEAPASAFANAGDAASPPSSGELPTGPGMGRSEGDEAVPTAGSTTSDRAQEAPSASEPSPSRSGSASSAEPTSTPASGVTSEAHIEPSAPETGEEHAPAPPRSLAQIIAEARELGVQVRDRQKKKQRIGKAGSLLKELTVLVKAGKAAEAEAKLAEIREELPEG